MVKLSKIMRARKRKRANGKALMKRNRKKKRMKTIVMRIVTNPQEKFKDLRAV